MIEWLKYCLIISLCTVYASAVNVTANPNLVFTDVIQTHSGPVRGFFRKNALTGAAYAAFLGIPYAEPPLKQLRFLPPIEIKPWKQVLQAVKFGNICPQSRRGQFSGNEDCLSLNIFTPETNFRTQNKLKAVMVWIHGGAFLMGSGNDAKYGPDFILDKDVILVTFNYRLGPIGFLNFNHEKIPGNAGLKDQHLVLKWVQKNIRQFGGDPNNVTLIGQSAGAVAVDLHNIANMSRGLYARSIAMSGSVFCPWGFMSSSKAENHAMKVVKKLIRCEKCNLNKTDKLITLLQNIPIETLVTNGVGVISQIIHLELPYVPSIETVRYNNSEPFIDECFLNKFRRGDVHNGDHITGFTSLEAGVALNFLEGTVEKTVKSAVDRIKGIWHNIWNRPKRTTRLLDNSFKPLSEVLFSAGIDLKQKFMVSYSPQNAVYYYYFTYKSNKSLMDGVVHSEDLRYLFLRKDTQPSLEHFGKQKNEPEQYNPDAMTRNRMVTMFTNFAKYGKPIYEYMRNNEVTDFVWSKSTKDGGYLEISNNLIMKPNSRPITPGVNDFQRMMILEYQNKTCVPNLRDSIQTFITNK